MPPNLARTLSPTENDKEDPPSFASPPPPFPAPTPSFSFSFSLSPRCSPVIITATSPTIISHAVNFTSYVPSPKSCTPPVLCIAGGGALLASSRRRRRPTQRGAPPSAGASRGNSSRSPLPVPPPPAASRCPLYTPWCIRTARSPDDATRLARAGRLHLSVNSLRSDRRSAVRVAMSWAKSSTASFRRLSASTTAASSSDSSFSFAARATAILAAASTRSFFALSTSFSISATMA